MVFNCLGLWSLFELCHFLFVVPVCNYFHELYLLRCYLSSEHIGSIMYDVDVCM